ncbi:hypothetical protein HRG_003959 [Hirsutella rhossiliensis]|uniref:Uncharacterized protein n=1 Tax=Hirsutella rhossiliensis TaxID=111463 RepID=A0A9P8SK38_9HYPO|nr:uncharacterized protein HRG_03959 [Hirsutella rhossiliensis]KAH0965943.1 hypothetical protein HRG_03959 [Hirsutella rhossiliensis]
MSFAGEARGVIDYLVGPLSQLAESNMLANIRWWCEELGMRGVESCQALGLPEEKLEGFPWPFESKLMADVIRAAEAGQVPAGTDMLLLTMCSSSGEIEPHMQPARRESQDNIQRLCSALQRLAQDIPGAGPHMWGCTAKAWAGSDSPLNLERWLIESKRQQEQHQQQQQQQQQQGHPPAPDALEDPGPVEPRYWDLVENPWVGIWADKDEDLPEDIHPGMLAYRRRAMASEPVETIDPALLSLE